MALKNKSLMHNFSYPTSSAAVVFGVQLPTLVTMKKDATRYQFYHHDIKSAMKILILILAICVFFSSCERDSYYKKIGMVQIYSSTMADTVLKNESTAIKIIASASNGCWSNLFVDLKSETSFDYSIKAYGTFSCRDGGCGCPDILVGMDTVINFQPTKIGKYTFNVYTSQDSITINSMIVN